MTARTAGSAARTVVGGEAALAVTANAKKDAHRITIASSITGKPRASLCAIGTAAGEAGVLIGRAAVLN